MKLKIIVCIIALFIVASATAEGIHFEDITLEQACEKAAKENKLVFVDCYTPWCGPCKFMAANIFPLDSCGQYMNPRFVSIMKDLDAEANRYIAKKYGVRIYPTFLLLRPDGSLYYKIEGGAVKQAGKFIARVENALKLGEMDARFDKGERGGEFILEYVENIGKNSPARVGKVLDEYFIALAPEELGSEISRALVGKINTPDCDAFRYIFKQRASLISSFGADTVGRLLGGVYEREFFNKRWSAGMDFSSRIHELEVLEQENMSMPNFLMERMLFRDVINKKDQVRLKTVASAVKRIGASDVPETVKLEVLSHLRGLNKAMGGKTDVVKKALNPVLKGMSENSRKRLESIL